MKDMIDEIGLSNNKNIFVDIINEPIKENTTVEFDQGKVSINLDNIAKKIKENNSDLKTELNTDLELCKDALLYKHYALIGTLSDVSPILWQEGGIARLKSGEKIEQLLNSGNATLTLGVNRFKRCCNNFERTINIRR